MSSRATDTTPSLLPPGATTLERDLEQATARMANVPTPFDTLWNADTCPAALLGWLAWALSVDEWDAGWSETIKRDAVRMAPLLHKRKGTVWALQNALMQFGVGTQVKEWWAMSPPGAPGTFALVTELRPDNIQKLGQLLTQKMNTQIKRVIDAIKPVSRTYSMSMTFAIPSQLTMASIGTASQSMFSSGTLLPFEIASATQLNTVGIGTSSQFVSSSGTLQ